MALLTGLDFRALNGVHLQEQIELGLGSPGTVVIVVADLPGGRVNDDRIHPVRKPNDQPAGLPAEEPSRAAKWRRNSSRLQAELTAERSRTSVLMVECDIDPSPFQYTQESSQHCCMYRCRRDMQGLTKGSVCRVKGSATSALSCFKVSSP